MAVAHTSAQISAVYKGLSVYRTLPVHERRLRLSKNSPETQLTIQLSYITLEQFSCYNVQNTWAEMRGALTPLPRPKV